MNSLTKRSNMDTPLLSDNIMLIYIYIYIQIIYLIEHYFKIH